ncbi:MAG: glycoside hydrolase family 127 protein [Bacteroidetes bacterium]|nr:glycoside hydrolase family 127 protein [Bacteroidota bacterium]
MLKSLFIYSRYLMHLVFLGERNIFLHDIRRYSFRKDRYGTPIRTYDIAKKISLEKAIRWLVHAQKMMCDNGIGSYHLVNRWSDSYPETTGYIIPTLLNYGHTTSNEEIIKSGLSAADWLVGIQKESGGWQGGRVNENKPEIVFNTAQVIRGMIAVYRYTGDQAFLDAAICAGDWLCAIQNQEGYWKTHALMNEARVYDSYVDFPLLELYKASGNKKYYNYALKNLDWIVDTKQLKNGWFEDCDNTIKHNDKPILHTIAYTIDGLLDCGIFLDEQKYYLAARKPAEVLMEKFMDNGYLNGRHDSNWNGSEYTIVTGCAQMSIIWLKLYQQSKIKRFLDAARLMNYQLIYIQNREVRETDDTLGAMPGSYPVWGKYEPFAFPNWATKYFADALMLEMIITKD